MPSKQQSRRPALLARLFSAVRETSAPAPDSFGGLKNIFQGLVLISDRWPPHSASRWTHPGQDGATAPKIGPCPCPGAQHSWLPKFEVFRLDRRFCSRAKDICDAAELKTHLQHPLHLCRAFQLRLEAVGHLVEEVTLAAVGSGGVQGAGRGGGGGAESAPGARARTGVEARSPPHGRLRGVARRGARAERVLCNPFRDPGGGVARAAAHGGRGGRVGRTRCRVRRATRAGKSAPARGAHHTARHPVVLVVICVAWRSRRGRSAAVEARGAPRVAPAALGLVATHAEERARGGAPRRARSARGGGRGGRRGRRARGGGHRCGPVRARTGSRSCHIGAITFFFFFFSFTSIFRRPPHIGRLGAWLRTSNPLRLPYTRDTWLGLLLCTTTDPDTCPHLQKFARTSKGTCAATSWPHARPPPRAPRVGGARDFAQDRQDCARPPRVYSLHAHRGSLHRAAYLYRAEGPVWPRGTVY